MRLACLPLLALCAFVAASCSDDETSAPVEPEGEPWTVDNYCERAAPLFCDAIAGCCNASGMGYDDERCEAYFRTELCQQKIEQVKSGRLIFAPALYSPHAAEQLVRDCMGWVADLASECESARGEDLFPRVAERNQRCHIFLGRSVIGETCEDSGDCAPTDSAVIPSCIDGVCFQATGIHFAYGFCPGRNFACQEGFYCDEELNRCTENTPLGEACVPHPDSAECGGQAYCDPLEGVCKPADALAGESCSLVGFKQCRSRFCRVGGICSHPVWWFEDAPLRRVAMSEAMCGEG